MSDNEPKPFLGIRHMLENYPQQREALEAVENAILGNFGEIGEIMINYKKMTDTDLLEAYQEAASEQGQPREFWSRKHNKANGFTTREPKHNFKEIQDELRVRGYAHRTLCMDCNKMMPIKHALLAPRCPDCTRKNEARR